MLKLNGVGEKLLNAVKAFYENCTAKVRINGKDSDNFMEVAEVKQDCIMLSWLFSIFMDGVKEEWKIRIQGDEA